MTELWRARKTATLRWRFAALLVVLAMVGVLAAGALAQGGKSGLIGKLEGPEVVTDSANAPKAF